MENALPLVTIGVVSYNRLNYLRALMTSARECIQYPNIQWIIVDGNSREPGLREYIDSLDFVQHKIFKECTHAEAMNTIVKEARGECLLLLPEDVQFMVRGNWLRDMVEVALANERVGHIIFNYQRRVTIQRLFGQAHLHLRLGHHRRFVPLPFRRRYNTYRSSRGVEFFGLGNLREGICGSGIMSFTRTEVWRTLGPWRTTNSKVGNDSSLGAEDDMVYRYLTSGLDLETVLMRFAVNGDIVTDDRGTKARVRGGNKRYGNYRAPSGGDLYYKILTWADVQKRFADIIPAPSFEDVVEPIGFPLPLDGAGNLLKMGALDTATEPFELIF
ncbi:MAG: glycosyltransferase family A protein [Bdellovibrionota bacterium]